MVLNRSEKQENKMGEHMSAGMVLATIFFCFISGAGAASASLLLFFLLESINKVWYSKAGERMPKILFKRGVLLALGPAIIAIFCALRIFIVIKTGSDVADLWRLVGFSAFGVYCMLISAFIFSLFREMEHLFGNSESSDK